MKIQMKEGVKLESNESERQRLLYVELPVLLQRILCLSNIPVPANKEFLEMDINEIKKITNTECESALERFLKY